MLYRCKTLKPVWVDVHSDQDAMHVMEALEDEGYDVAAVYVPNDPELVDENPPKSTVTLYR